MDIVSIINSIPFKLILSGILFFAYWIQAFFIIYHLIRFGIGPKPKIVAMIFFVGSIFLTLVLVTTIGGLAFDYSSSGFNFSWPDITNLK